jgi:hypothetical protein
MLTSLTDFVMASPNYPDAYDLLKDCGWQIAPASADPTQRVLISFDFVDLISPQYVAVSSVDGNVKQYTKISRPFDVLLDSNVGRIRFNSGTNSTAKKGKGYSFAYHCK